MAGAVYCIRGSNGADQWTLPFSALGSPAVADVDVDGLPEVVIGAQNGTVYCLSGATGATEWTYSLGSNLMNSPAIGNLDGDAALETVIGGYDSTIVCLDGITGAPEWTYKANSWIGYATPAIADLDKDGQLEVVVDAQSGTVYCFNGSNGAVEWTYSLGGSSRDSDPSIADIDGDGTLEVILMRDDGPIHVLNGPNGAFEWTYAGGGYHSVIIADIDGDDCLELVHTDNGSTKRLVALDDAGNASGCGAVGNDEKGGQDAVQFRAAGTGLYLSLPGQTEVSLSLYDAQGRLVQVIYDGILGQGEYTFYPAPGARGVYIALLTHGETTRVIRIVR